VLRVADRHVLKQIASPLAAAMAIGLLMLLSERLVRLLDTTLGKKNSFAVVFEMLAYLVPHYLGTAIPAALFLGLLFGFSRMSANSETDAFMAAGIGLHRLARPVIILAGLLSLASLFVFGWAQPYARYAFREVVSEVKNVEFFYLAEEGVFMQAGGRTFILDTLDRKRNAFDHVFIHDDRGNQGSETITATRGALIDVVGQARPILRLEQGHRLDFKERPSYAKIGTVNPEVTEFALADTPLGEIDKNIFRPRGDDARELTLSELFTRLGSPPKGITEQAMRTEVHKRLVNAISPLVLPFLALPFTIGSRRSRRAYRFGVALILIVMFHEIVEQGSVAAQSGSISPWIAMWLPLGVLTLFAAWRYYSTCFTVNRNVLDDVIDRVGESFSAWYHRILRRFGWELAS
jgi:lipopolysaccharide export system permease protein